MPVILSSAPSRGSPVPIFPPDLSEAINVFPRCSLSTELIEFGFSRIVTLIYSKQAECTARACLVLTRRCLLALSLAVAIKACRGFRNSGETPPWSGGCSLERLCTAVWSSFHLFLPCLWHFCLDRSWLSMCICVMLKNFVWVWDKKQNKNGVKMCRIWDLYF